MSVFLWIFIVYTILMVVIFFLAAKEVHRDGFQRGIHHERWLISPNKKKMRKAQSVKVDIMLDYGRNHVMMFLPCTYAQSFDLCVQIAENDIRESKVMSSWQLKIRQFDCCMYG